MSDKERAAALLDMVPEDKMGYVIAYLQGVLTDEAEDAAFCAGLYRDYLSDPDPRKRDAIPLKTLAADLGVELQ